MDECTIFIGPYVHSFEQKHITCVENGLIAVSNGKDRTLSCGTTTACYFCTIYVESCITFVEELIEAGQRAFVGKVNMNTGCPPEYSETTSSSIADTEKFIDFMKNIKNSLVKLIITPRFAVTCDMPLMTTLAELAKKHDLYIQTHISENKDEVNYVKEIFPECSSYTDVYDKAGLLTKKTVLAHGVYLTNPELKLLKERGSSIAHCPISNTSLQSGFCNVRMLLNEGLSVGLGTDVAGGYSPSIINCMRAAMNMSIHISFLHDNHIPLNYHEVFYLATLGGAKALQMENLIGNFTMGKDFDALRIDLNCQDTPIDYFNELTLSEKLQKFLYLGDDRNIRQVYVKGNLVKNKIQ
ncbi:guanine deaminase isoform X2 [Lycorma delicatula]|uniref:guanine deaminase isoform X2 n=1 Tax=Lycorma delicatula TaxID=130591 RepID=UPI003F512B02